MGDNRRLQHSCSYHGGRDDDWCNLFWPFAMTVASEAAAARDRSSFIRFWIAISADVAVCALIYIASRPADSRMDYRQVSEWLLILIGLTPLLLYGASATAQTILRGRRITFFEASQTLVAFLLAAWSMLAFRSGGAVALGLLCLVASVVGYGLVYARFGATTQQRNFHVYAVGSAALFSSGCLPVTAHDLADYRACHSCDRGNYSWSSNRASYLGISRLDVSLGGRVVFLACCSMSLTPLTSTVPTSPTGLISIVAVAAVVSYALERRFQADQWQHYFLDVLSAILAVGATAAFLVYGLVRLTQVAITPGVSHVAVIRTLTTCVLALLLAYAGSRWKRKELGWLAYGALVFVASKLVFEDMRHGHLGFTAVSIFLYAITLLSVPRLVRLARKQRAYSDDRCALQTAPGSLLPPRAESGPASIRQPRRCDSMNRDDGKLLHFGP